MTTPHMLKSALWYANHGFYVFPLHTPTFDAAGSVTGCTCEHYRQSEECKRKHPHLYLGRDGKCDQPGKCPRVKWHEKSTIDAATLRKWWKWWPNANIGIDAGKSDLLILDADLYKATYAGEAFQIDTGTVASRTGGGGLHLWYRQPAGKAYGNAKGELPAGIDIRGEGGYIVAAPSLHHSGRRYAFVEGRSPANLAPLPLPASLVAILDAAQTASAKAVTFAAGAIPEPDLARWDLSAATLELIHNGASKGERSEADYRVILALARAGADDDDIRAVFVHFAIGEKYHERGDAYLSLTIGKARAWLEDHPPDPPATVERLAAARVWVRGVDCLNRLRAVGVRRVADLVPVLDALIEIAQPRRTSRIVTTMREVADRCGLAASTAFRRLTRLVDAGLLTTKPDPYGTLIDLSPLLDLSGTLSLNVYPVPVGSSSPDDFFAEHRADDAFTSYPYSYALKRRMVPTVLLQSLGASGLLLWSALQDGGTITDLATITGLTVPTVRTTIKRFDQAGLLVIWQEGRAKSYELHPNAWDRLEERREHMTTAGIGQLRAARNANDRASFAERKLQGRMPLEAGERAKLEMRRDRADQLAQAGYAALERNGINPHARVSTRQPRVHTLKVDHGEEWVSVDRPIYEQWQELAPLPFEERYRMLGMAGYARGEIDKARHKAGKMGKGPRQFIGVGEPQGAPTSAVPLSAVAA